MSTNIYEISLTCRVEAATSSEALTELAEAIRKNNTPLEMRMVMQQFNIEETSMRDLPTKES